MRKQWIGRAFLMGLWWAGLWLLPSMIVGSILVGELEPEHLGGAIFFGLPCGLVFSVLSGHAARLQRWEHMSPRQGLAYGALSGAVIMATLFILGSDFKGDPAWALPVFMFCSLSALCAVTAAVVRWATTRAAIVS